MNDKLTVGIVCYPTFGGSGVVATEIGMGLAARGHKVHFISYDVPRRLDTLRDNIFFHEVEVRDYPLFTYPPYSLALTSKMVEVATYERLDILHVHYAVPHATSAYLAHQILGKQAPKIITTLHGTDITLVGSDRSYLPITRFSITESDAVTAPSEYLRRATYDKLNVPTATHIEVIPNFVDTELYKPATELEMSNRAQVLGICKNAEKVITHVSNFRAVKRVTDVVKIFAKIAANFKAHLILVGDGPERSNVERLVHDLNLVGKVCFLGKQNSFEKILKVSDLFLLPSESESFGLAALEAMSCGVPVIASDVHGIPEVVKDGVVGFLSDVGDVEKMGADAVRLLGDKKLHDAFRNAARKVVEDNYKQTDLVPRYEQYYWKVLGQ